MTRDTTGRHAAAPRTFGAAWTCVCTAATLAYAVAVQPSWPPPPLACSGLAGLSLALGLAIARAVTVRHLRRVTSWGT